MQDKNVTKPGGKLSSEIDAFKLDEVEEVIKPTPDKETIDKYVDVNETHIILPGDFSTTYIPKQNVDEEAIKNGKIK